MEKTSVNMGGNVCETIKKGDKLFIQPWFHGQVLGEVVDTFPTEDSSGLNILLLTQESSQIGAWITVTYTELNRMEIGKPVLGARLYFCVIQKVWHNPNTRPYHIVEGWVDVSERNEEICPIE